MKLALTKGTTGVTVNVFIQNSSSSVGAGLTGLAYNTSGLNAYYVRERAAAAAISLATQTATGVYSSGGFVEIDATNMPGWYRLDIPDAALATGSNSVGILLKGATNMAPLTLEIQLSDDPWAKALPGAFAAGSAGYIVGNYLTGDAFARIGAGGSNLSGVPWNPAWDADVQSEVQDAIEVNHLDHLLAVTYDPAAKPGAVDALLNEIIENDLGVSRFTANALETSASGGLDAAGIRAAVGLTNANLDTQFSNIPLNVWSYVVESTMTAVQAMRGIFAATVNKLSGASTTTITIRDKADSKNRITATVDADGNRTAVTTDLT